MKLKTLAIAIAAAAMPFAAQAELKIGGDVTVGYFQDENGTKTLDENGSEINIDASEKVGGITFYGHTEVDFQGTGNAAEFQEVRVGAKGAFGEVILGDADNACDQLDVAATNEVWLNHTQGGCKGSDRNNVVYKRAMGPATVALSHNPQNNNDNVAVGVKGKVGPVTMSVGYEDGEFGQDGNNVLVEGKNLAYGVSGTFGPFGVGVAGNDFKGSNGYADSDSVGANFIYTRGGNSIYGGLGLNDGNDTKSLGYKRTMGKTDFIAEAVDTGVANEDTKYGVGMRHRF